MFVKFRIKNIVGGMGYCAGETNLLYYNENPFVISDVINSELKLVTD